MAFLIWLVISIVAAVLCLFVCDEDTKFINKLSHATPLRGLAIVLAVVIVFSPVYYEFPAVWGPTQVITFNEDGSVNYRPFGAFCLEGSDSYANMPNGSIDVFSNVSPVTENPKVRPLKYKVDVTIENPTLFYAVPERRTLIGNDYENERSIRDAIREITEYWLYEFNEKNSTTLGKFYNPRDEAQNAELKEMIESWIKPKVSSDGLTVEFVSFSLAY